MVRPLEVRLNQATSAEAMNLTERQAESAERIGGEGTDPEVTATEEAEQEFTEGLPNYDEVMESRRSRDGESGSVIGLPLYRERDDGGDGGSVEADGHDRNSIGVIIGNGSSTEGFIATTARHWAFVEDERPGWA